ncbi:hypothetical protein Q5H93_06615 [Hymenobacter sp. ASUV-10]|uniref:YcxB family protein n=1 Tax=Hymenobacter aranciens TaxID=3063996 RepID=A0ABT9B7Z1_9BACT|nr:hypothetical protein [Hymenobacter sp. ASUV-10]MDO7874399.1 hypothetical protein [Hymenobacter sp. ASUV-10]
MITQLTRSFRPTPHDQRVAKLYNFRRRSLWRYLLAALLLSAARPGLLGSFALTWLGLSAGLVLLGLAVVLLSSYRMGPASFAAEVTFRAEGIEVRPADGAPAQAHDWRWLRRADESGRYFFLTVRDLPRLILLLDKHRLAPEEITAFRAWVAARPAG